MTARFTTLLVLASGIAGSADASPPVESRTWYASANLYVLEDEGDYVQPTLFTDRGRLHLEARYNYEDRGSGSLWAGINLSAGDEFVLEFTPMLGVVFGPTAGIAPGYKASLGWRKLELYSEAEYVVDAGDSDDSYFYTWSELSIAPSEGWRTGMVVQRTKAYQSDFDIQRGLLAGLHRGRFDVTAYLLNPDGTPTWVLGVGAEF